MVDGLVDVVVILLLVVVCWGLVVLVDGVVDEFNVCICFVLVGWFGLFLVCIGVDCMFVVLCIDN